MTPNLVNAKADIWYMENDLSAARMLGYMFLSVAAVGIGSLALITVVYPEVQTGVMRFLLLMVITSGILMAVIWAGVASAIAIRWRLHQPE